MARTKLTSSSHGGAVPDQRFLIYWLHYHLNRQLGESVLEVEGTAPHYMPNGEEDPSLTAGDPPGPLPPRLATIFPEKYNDGFAA